MLGIVFTNQAHQLSRKVYSKAVAHVSKFPKDIIVVSGRKTCGVIISSLVL